MDNRRLECTPIGYFYSLQTEKYMAPKQAALGRKEDEGVIRLIPDCNFEQALEDLSGFDHIWLIYWFDRNQGWKPRVLPPGQTQKKGVFATRSPHRPNPFGLSCVELLKIEKRELYIGKHDLLNETPILDIKPYLPYADAFPESRCGWLENAHRATSDVQWTEIAKAQAIFIQEQTQIRFIESVELRLSDNPYPFSNHRIRKIDNDEYELAFKTWRIRYSLKDSRVIIQYIASGYDQETLQGSKASAWNDLPVHLEFLKRFKGL